MALFIFFYVASLQINQVTKRDEALLLKIIFNKMTRAFIWSRLLLRLSPWWTVIFLEFLRGCLLLKLLNRICFNVAYVCKGCDAAIATLAIWKQILAHFAKLGPYLVSAPSVCSHTHAHTNTVHLGAPGVPEEGEVGVQGSARGHMAETQPFT